MVVRRSVVSAFIVVVSGNQEAEVQVANRLVHAEHDVIPGSGGRREVIPRTRVPLKE